MSEMGGRVLVVGCGAIGGVIAGYLLEVGYDVTLLTTNPEIARALREQGIRLGGESAPPTIAAPAVHEALDGRVAPFDYVFLATQPPQVEKAAIGAAPWLTESGRMVCFQNGLCEERIAALIGPDRVI